MLILRFPKCNQVLPHRLVVWTPDKVVLVPDDDSLMAAARLHHGADKQAKPSESTAQQSARCLLAHCAMALELKPDTGATLAWIG